MNSVEMRSIPEDLAENLFSHIPLFKEILKGEPDLIDFFTNHSKLFTAKPGEVVIKRGEFDQWIYFLLIGQLQAYPEFADKKNHLVSHIASGEMFGELAFIRKMDRNATIIADNNSHEIMFLGTNFNGFGEINDFSVASMNSKIIFYKTIVGIILKRLQSFQIDHPDHDLYGAFKGYTPYSGMHHTINELLYYFDQAKDLAKTLYKWNRAIESDGNFYPSKGKIPLDLVQEIHQLI